MTRFCQQYQPQEAANAYAPVFMAMRPRRRLAG